MSPPKISIHLGHIPNEVIGLWCIVYHNELGWLPALSEEQINDGYHRDCVYLLAQIRDRPVGTAMIVFPRNGLLPVETFAGGKPLVKDTNSKTELTRLMVIKEHRGEKCVLHPYGVFHHLMVSYLNWVDSKKFKYSFMDVRERHAPHSLVNRLEHYGFTCLENRYPDPLGTKFPHCTTMIRSK